ncbi:MAG TPA: adenylate/guanylate cyclase domain-containing protein [Gaiellaceae bacterium]|nr:adenylate/guanylate cyclase domain-containing protein [Gaiellaceae bacterium]
MDVPDVSYAWSGDVAIAYQALGEGPQDLVLLPFLANIYTLWQAPRFEDFGRRLATGRRLIVVNSRGVGLSDRPRGFTVESRMDDIRVVMDDARSERATLIGWAEQAATCAFYAATYPDRVDRLVLSNPWGWRFSRDRAAREHALKEAHEERERWGRRDYLETLAARINPQWAEDREYVDWFVWHHRLTASPAAWLEFRRMQIDLDLTDVLPTIRVPTLVLSKAHVREEGERIAEAIPDCQFVLVPGQGGAMQENDYSAEAIEVFLAGEAQLRIPDTVLATVLFTDLVGSTERAAALGDRSWRELLERHNTVVRRELERFRGVELDTAGDGFFASFDGPARAIACACAIVEQVRALGLEVRAGIHTGECERIEGKLGGIAVPIGARIMGLARDGEVLVSGTVKDLVAGSGLEFEDRGVHELKGVPGGWKLFAVHA